MSETIQTFLDKVKEAAQTLGERPVIDLLNAVGQQVGDSKLRILIVGGIGSGRHSLANLILGKPELLPASPIPKAPVTLQVSYGDADAVEILACDGTRSMARIEKLRQLLINPAEDKDRCESIHVRTKVDLLRTCDLRIEAIPDEQSATGWKEILAAADFVLLVLKGASILSQDEKTFIRDLLAPSFGLERVAIVINQMDMVPEEERPSLVELVRAFLGSFERHAIILELSAAQVGKGLQSGNVPVGSGYETLKQLVEVDLLENQSSLKSTTVRQAAEICLSELAAGVTRQTAFITTSQGELNEMLRKLDEQADWMRARIGRAQNKVEISINTIIKEQFLRDMEGVGDALRAQLADEVQAVEDIAEIKKYLPAYLEALWEKFFENQLRVVRVRLVDEMKRVAELVNDDLEELLGSKAVGFGSLIGGFNPSPTDTRLFLMPHRTENDSNKAAWVLGLGGGAAMLFFANIPLGLAALGAGQVIRLLNKKSVEAAEKQAVIDAAIEATHELEKQIKSQVEGQFAQIADSVKKAVADVYAEGVSRVRASLEEGVVRHSEFGARKDQIERLSNETLPALRQQLDELGGQPSAA
jgi:hypothetical protein